MTKVNAELIAAIEQALSSIEEDAPASKPTRAQRSAANKSLYRKIQGQKGNITRAAKKGDKEAFVAAVQQADNLCPENWTMERDRIKTKATEQAVVLNAALATA
jgi:hypothetical protein